jgi:HAD superfamily hydrolase (TIGR01509 family)
VSADALRHTGKPFPEDFDKQFSLRLRSVFEEKLTPIEGAAAFIRALRMPIAVASSSILRSLHWKLEKTELNSPFGEHIYSTEHVRRGKPEPDLFLYAAERIGADPASTLVLEDSINGIKAARAAGMVAVGFCGGGHCSADHGETLLNAGAHHITGSYADLTRLLGPGF